MVRKLKFHEKKLLKKVDFISWEIDKNIPELKVMRAFHINRREDLTKYKKIARQIRSIARKIKQLDPKDPFRGEATSQLLEKLYFLGLTKSKHSLEVANSVKAQMFCRRRLPVMLVRKQMAQNLKVATNFVEQGHVRVGPEVVSDPGYLVTRNMEDFITWTDTSSIRKQVLEYNEMRDDFDQMG